MLQRLKSRALIMLVSRHIVALQKAMSLEVGLPLFVTKLSTDRMAELLTGPDLFMKNPCMVVFSEPLLLLITTEGVP